MKIITLRLLINLFFVFALQPAFAQSPSSIGEVRKPIDMEALRNWTDFTSAPNITADGKFASFFIDNETPGYKTVLMTETDGNWSKKIVARDFGYGDAQFSGDSKFCIFSAGDSLAIVRLGSADVQYIPYAKNASFLSGDGSKLVYDIEKPSQQCILYDLAADKRLLTIDGESRVISPGGRYLVCKRDTMEQDTKASVVSLYDLKDLNRQTIWLGAPASGFKFDETGNKLAFIVGDNSKAQAPNSLAIFVRGSQSAQIICSANSICDLTYFTAIENFNQDGNRLFVSVTTLIPKPTPLATNAKVDVWNFNDIVPQWRQLQSPHERQNAEFGVNLGDHSLYKLKDDWEYNTRNYNNDFFSDKFMSIKGYAEAGAMGSDQWNKALRQSITLVNTLNGQRRLIDSNLQFYAINGQYILSPDGRFMLYYNFKSHSYFSYELPTGIRRNLTRVINTLWSYVHFDIPELDAHLLRGIAAWIRNSDDVLIYDRYDIWRISLDGSRQPVCITNGYGKRTKTRFVLPGDRPQATPIGDDARLYLSAFNEETKKNGFFEAIVNRQQDPRLLTMGDCVYYAPDIVHNWGNTIPVKASGADKWIVCRQSATSSRNYFVTRDFRTFRSLTDVHPEKAYNWLTTELIRWRLPDGRIAKGILYKPQDFDPARKYPLIFNYYEFLSDNLHVYIEPELSVGDINIPYYVSNGYLVFTPDIRGSKEGAGWDAVNTMVSAASYLTKFPFVDAKRMGIQGGSMGGYKTQFIISQTRLFAAANAMCGISNLSSMALHPGMNSDNEDVLQYGQFYLGYSIVDRPDLYVKSSPIFYVRNIQTPLLLAHNPKDDHVPDLQSIDMFNALRRAGKRVWLLQYDGYGHGVGFSGNPGDMIAQTDYTIRQKQFFDYYLKGAQAPEWMVTGVPARLKGVDNGLELMPPGVRVPDSKIVDQ